jgi:hypothetical protein
MTKQVDPKIYDLPSRTVLMKIKEKIQGASVVLEKSAPVCSKSIKFLEENNVDIVFIKV